MLSELFDIFTRPVVGGAMIGLSAALLMVFNGRVAGLSGILAGALTNDHGAFERAWRTLFVVGLLVGGGLLALVDGPAVFEDTVNNNWLVLAVAGLLVGFGTRLGSGCTSGHGICGLARFSRRSLVSVVTFIAAGIATVVVVSALRGMS